MLRDYGEMMSFRKVAADIVAVRAADTHGSVSYMGPRIQPFQRRQSRPPQYPGRLSPETVMLELC